MKKGFTLIELLAVIVILAIIALIATPIILEIINDAKEDSEKRSVENYAHAVELAVARDASKNGGVIEDGDYEIDTDSKGKKIKKGNIVIEIDYKGETLTNGTIKVAKDGKIEIIGISFNEGKTTYNYSETLGVTKAENSEDGDSYVSSPFKVTDDGILFHYERQGNETSVVVPAKVGDIKITSILQEAFVQGDVIIINNDTVIGLNKEALEKKAFAEQAGMNFIMIDEFGKGNDPIMLSEFLEWNTNIDMYKYNLIDSNDIISRVTNDISNYSLTEIDLSNMNYLEVIGDDAFHGYYEREGNCQDYSCAHLSPLRNVKLPMNGVLKKIGNGAFSRNSLEIITIPSSVEIIGQTVFDTNINLSKIIIKRASKEGMTLGFAWNRTNALGADGGGYSEVVYDPN